MGLLDWFASGKDVDEDDEPKGLYEDPKDPLGLGRDAAENHQRWLDERSKDP